MSRPKKHRVVSVEPGVTYFKPRAVPLTVLEEVTLTIAELEVIRLCDYQSKGQKDAAQKMGVSQPTLNRLLKSARKKVSDALSNGKAIKIEGGNYKLEEQK